MNKNNNDDKTLGSSEEGYESPSLELSNSGGELSFLAELNALTNQGPFREASGKIAPRMFKLEEKIIFAFLIEETKDSFLVVFPSILKEVEGNIGFSHGVGKNVIASQLIPTVMCRLLKSNVTLVALPTHLHLLTFLQSSMAWVSELPGYFTTKRVTQIESLISVLKQKLRVEFEVIEVEAGGFPPGEDGFISETPDRLLLLPEFWPKQRH